MEVEPCLENGPKRPKKSGGCRTFSRIRMEGPDGGYAWAVAFAACIISFIMAGLGRMSGILYVAFIETFRVDRMAASTPFSVRSSVRNLLGPVVGILGQKYGVRAVTITGGIFATISASACFFAPDIVWITVLWGVLNGVGTALSVTLPQVVIGKYFIKYTTTASGMAFSGGCIGSFVFPVLLEELLLSYGMQGTFLVIGAIIMHTIPAGMVLKMPPWLNTEHGSQPSVEDVPTVRSRRGSVGLNNENSVKLLLNDKDNLEEDCRNGKSKPRKDQSYPDTQFLRDNPDLVLKILTLKVLGEKTTKMGLEINQNESSEETAILDRMEEMYSSFENSREKSQSQQKLKINRLKMCSDLIREDNLKTIGNHKSQSFLCDRQMEFGLGDVPKTNSVPDFLRKSNEVSQNCIILKLKKLRDVNSDVLNCLPEDTRDEASLVLQELKKLYIKHTALNNQMKGSFLALCGTTPLDPLTSESMLEKPTDEHPNTFRDHIKTAMNLHKKPLFLLICLCRSVHFMTLVPVMTVVVDFVMDKGLREDDGKYAIAALSLGDLLGRLCFGWVTDRGYMGLPRYMMVVMVLQGASTLALPLMYTKLTLYLMLAIFGLLQGSLFVRHNVLVSKYMENHEQSIAMGCVNFFSGLLGFGLPAYIGYFRDTIGTYDYIFYINGTVGILTGLLWLLEPYFRQCSTPEKSTELESPIQV